MAKRRHRTQLPTGKEMVDQMIVSGLAHRATTGYVRIALGRTIRCALGRSGRRALKREGDGATPIGVWRFRDVFYRSDRVARPICGLRVKPLRPHDGWCDAPSDTNYNRHVVHPYPASAERMWRSDHLYDIVVVLGYNDLPRRRGCGSAIFLHLNRPGYLPTEGCVAVSLKDMRAILSQAGSRSALRILG